MSLGIGEGKDTYAIIQSIMRNRPIVCANKEVRKSLVLNGKKMAEMMYPTKTVDMPTPITFEEFDSGNFNRSKEYIFDSLDEYLKYKSIKVGTVILSEIKNDTES